MSQSDPVAYNRLALPEDIALIAPNLREADVQELAASCPAMSPAADLGMGFMKSVCCSTMVRTKDADHEPVGMWGIAPGSHDKSGVIWMLGTDRLVNDFAVVRTFLRECLNNLQVIFDEGLFTSLYNIVDGRNEVHMRYLQWIGFDINPNPISLQGVDFYQFSMTKEEFYVRTSSRRSRSSVRRP